MNLGKESYFYGPAKDSPGKLSEGKIKGAGLNLLLKAIVDVNHGKIAKKESIDH